MTKSDRVSRSGLKACASWGSTPISSLHRTRVINSSSSLKEYSTTSRLLRNEPTTSSMHEPSKRRKFIVGGGSVGVSHKEDKETSLQLPVHSSHRHGGGGSLKEPLLPIPPNLKPGGFLPVRKVDMTGIATSAMLAPLPLSWPLAELSPLVSPIFGNPMRHRSSIVSPMSPVLPRIISTHWESLGCYDPYRCPL